jgi:hypothetical protein
MTTYFLKPEHHPGQFVKLCSGAPSSLAYLPVLTEYAPQVAVGHKDGPGAASANKWPFFTKVRVVGCNNQIYTRSTTKPLPSFHAIDTTSSGTELATLRNGQEFICSLSQFTCSVKFQVGRFKSSACRTRFFDDWRCFMASCIWRTGAKES